MNQLYTRRLENIEAVLQRWLPETHQSAWASEVFPGLDMPDPQYVQALTAPCRDLLSRGGKRWRPLLMVLACESLGGGDAALPLSPLVEFCHNASLIHDDIEDNADERRGKPAVHIIHGMDTAINSGSFLYFLPLACIDSWAAELGKSDIHRAQAYALWGVYLRKLHLGQAMDIHWHRNFDKVPSIGEYHAMCRLKTGCLARFAAELGALAAETVRPQNPQNAQSSSLIDQLGEAAEKMGVGFQVLDDVKNLTTGIPGKKLGDDIVEGKKSLPILLFLHRQPEQKAMVSRCFTAAGNGGVGVPEVEELIQALCASGVLSEANEQGRALIAEARRTFDGAGCTMLSALTEYIS